MNIEAERFKLIGAHGTREAAKLMDELDAKVRDTLVSQVKHVIHSEEMVREAIRKRHPEAYRCGSGSRTADSKG